METEGPPVLVCGATGFVGRALTARLRQEGRRVRALTRRPHGTYPVGVGGVDYFEGDLVDGTGLEAALAGVSVAYYLVHSMGASPGGLDFAERDRRAATHFAEAAGRAGVSRIIYLGGLGDGGGARSPHLASRREVGRLLRSGSPSVTELRAGIVVGAGGSSFEMMVQLVEHLPVMVCPRWIDSRCQPIALADLVRYLAGCAGEERTRGAAFDVGGPDVLRYSEMLMRIGGALGRRPCLLVVPQFTPGLSAHWVGYITDVSPDLARPIVDGMYVDALCREDRIRALLPGPLQPFDGAVEAALRGRRRAAHGPRLLGGHIARPFEGRTFHLGRARGPRPENPSSVSGGSGPAQLDVPGDGHSPR